MYKYVRALQKRLRESVYRFFTGKTPQWKIDENRKKYGYGYFIYDQDGKFAGVGFMPPECSDSSAY